MNKFITVSFLVLLASQTFAHGNCKEQASIALQGQGVTITTEMDKNIALKCLEKECYKIKADYLMNVDQVVITSQHEEAIRESCEVR